MPYSYVWSHDNSTSATASNLPAGTHTVTITDANQYTNTCQVTIGQSAALTCSIVKNSDASCFGFSDGSATVSGQGGTMPYSYVWSHDNSNSATASNLPAGTHTVTITDANQCTNTCQVTIGQPAALTCSASVTPTSCPGEADGSVTAVGAGGTPPYMYSNGGAYQMSGTFTGLVAGLYTITVEDANGCQSTCQATVQDAPEPTCTAECPDDELIDPDMTQAFVDAEFDTWKGAFGFTGDCNSTIIYKINDVPIDLDTLSAPDRCGGDLTLEIVVESDCNKDSCEATFVVIAGVGELIVQPIPNMLNTCVNTATPPSMADVPPPREDEEIISQFVIATSTCTDLDALLVEDELTGPNISGN